MKRILKMIIVIDILLAITVSVFSEESSFFSEKKNSSNEGTTISSNEVSDAETESFETKALETEPSMESSEIDETEIENDIEEKSSSFLSDFLNRLFPPNTGKGKDESEATITAADTSEAVTEKEIVHTYEVCAADITWSSANKLAKASGGHLLTLSNEDELNQVASLIEEVNPELKYIWIGGCQDSSGNYVWITGEEFSYAPWYSNGNVKEPSYKDTDGTDENCICLWNIGGEWSINDQRDDLSSAGSFVKGKIGYVIEYEN